MTLRSWRIVKRQYRDQVLSGEGPRLFGGRWNRPGFRVVYTAEYASLAVLEILVHLVEQSMLSNYLVADLHFDDGLVEQIPMKELPRNWRSSPPPSTLQSIGTRWLTEGRSAVLAVPSAVLPIETNYLINPEHPDFRSVEMGEINNLDIDPRLSR